MDNLFNTKNYETDGGNRLVINGELEISASGKMTASGHQFVLGQSVGGDESAKINSILEVLQSIGLVVVEGSAPAPGLEEQFFEVTLNSDSLWHEVEPTVLRYDSPSSLIGAVQIEGWIDGRIMPRGMGWTVSDDGTAFLLYLSDNPDRRMQVLGAEPVWSFRWYR